MDKTDADCWATFCLATGASFEPDRVTVVDGYGPEEVIRRDWNPERQRSEYVIGRERLLRYLRAMGFVVGRE